MGVSLRLASIIVDVVKSCNHKPKKPINMHIKVEI